MNKHISHCQYSVYNLIVNLQRKLGKIRIKCNAYDPLILEKTHHHQDQEVTARYNHWYVSFSRNLHSIFQYYESRLIGRKASVHSSLVFSAKVHGVFTNSVLPSTSSGQSRAMSANDVVFWALVAAGASLINNGSENILHLALMFSFNNWWLLRQALFTHAS